MYNPDTDLIFPPRTLPSLGDLRGESWRVLIDHILSAGQNSREQMAFILMMARLNNCTTCNTDSYRAMSGCTACSKQSIKRFRESDDALNDLYQQARNEVEQYLLKHAYLQLGAS
jgi:hypothetical protein